MSDWSTHLAWAAAIGGGGLGLAAYVLVGWLGSGWIRAARQIISRQKVKPPPISFGPAARWYDRPGAWVGAGGLGMITAGGVGKVLWLPAALGVGALTGLGVLAFARPLLKRAAAAHRVQEWLFYLRAVTLYLQAGEPMLAALRACLAMAPELRPALGRALEHWAVSPEAAIAQISRELPYTSVRLTLGLVRQAAAYDPAGAAEFLQAEIGKMRRLEHLRSEEAAALQPHIYSFYLAIPIFTFVALIFFALGARVLKELGQLYR